MSLRLLFLGLRYQTSQSPFEQYKKEILVPRYQLRPNERGVSFSIVRPMVDGRSRSSSNFIGCYIVKMFVLYSTTVSFADKTASSLSRNGFPLLSCCRCSAINGWLIDKARSCWFVWFRRWMEYEV